MPHIVFIPAGRPARVVEATAGATLMRVAVDHNIPGILADCGGELSCGTCHAYIDEATLALLPPAGAEELALLEDGVIDPQPNSRLTCQITVTDALEGIEVRVPPPF